MPPQPIPPETRYAVVVCPRCRHAKGIDRTTKTTTCGRCGARHETRGLRILYATGEAHGLHEAVGLIETKVTGGDTGLLDVAALREEIEARRGTDLARTGPPSDADRDDVIQYAASTAATVVSVAKKVRRIFEALDETRPRGWTLEDAEDAFEAAGLPRPRAEQEIRKALVQDEVYEPRPGHLRLLA